MSHQSVCVSSLLTSTIAFVTATSMLTTTMKKTVSLMAFYTIRMVPYLNNIMTKMATNSQLLINDGDMTRYGVITSPTTWSSTHWSKSPLLISLNYLHWCMALYTISHPSEMSFTSSWSHLLERICQTSTLEATNSVWVLLCPTLLTTPTAWL